MSKGMVKLSIRRLPAHSLPASFEPACVAFPDSLPAEKRLICPKIGWHNLRTSNYGIGFYSRIDSKGNGWFPLSRLVWKLAVRSMTGDISAMLFRSSLESSNRQGR